jgi:ribonuclease BN (tRNA processing enzyme)
MEGSAAPKGRPRRGTHVRSVRVGSVLASPRVNADEESMKLTVLGCSPAWPDPGGAHSGYLVEGSGRVLLDCGPGVVSRMRELPEWPAPDGIVITHWHLDHWGDLVPWAYGRPRDGAELWLPPGGRERARELGARLGFGRSLEHAFELREYRDGEPFPVAGLEVTPVRVPHYSLESYALRVANGNASVAYSGDSAPSERLVAAARDADLFLCEATLERAQADGELRGHLTVEEAVDAAGAAGVGRLVVTHRPRELSVPAGVERAHEGLELAIER